MAADKAFSVAAFIVLLWSPPKPQPVPLGGMAPDTLASVSPTQFPEVPETVRDELLRRGCSIPQETGRTGLRNVIHGSFSGRGANVWAALCSRQGRTTLLVLRPGVPIRVDSLSVWADDPGRRIDVAEPAYVWRHAAGIAKAPQDTAGLKRLLMHQGIEDVSGCCTVVHFWDGFHWRKMPGAD